MVVSVERMECLPRGRDEMRQLLRSVEKKVEVSGKALRAKCYNVMHSGFYASAH